MHVMRFDEFYCVLMTVFINFDLKDSLSHCENNDNSYAIVGQISLKTYFFKLLVKFFTKIHLQDCFDETD